MFTPSNPMHIHTNQVTQIFAVVAASKVSLRGKRLFQVIGHSGFCRLGALKAGHSAPHQKKPSQGSNAMDWAKGCSAKQNRTTKKASSPAGYTDGSHTHQLHQGATQHGICTKHQHRFHSGCGGGIARPAARRIDSDATSPTWKFCVTFRPCGLSWMSISFCSDISTMVNFSNNRDIDCAVGLVERAAALERCLATLSPLLCYVFSSCLCNGGGGLVQFRPVLLPIIRSQVAARNSSPSCLLNCKTTPCRNLALKGLPFMHSGNGDTNHACE